MLRAKLLRDCAVVFALASSIPAWAGGRIERKAFAAPAESPQVAELWRPRNPGSLDTLHGSGGEGKQPAGRYTFLKEDRGGSSPKFDVVDANGVQWKAKLGEEARPETAATRLVWAAGYYTDDDYYLPIIHVARMPVLRRGHQFIAANGTVRGVRLERKYKGRHTDRHWSWFSNPFSSTKELNGLRVMMALTNNWDLKEVNNDVQADSVVGRRYVVSDLGSTFGRTGNVFRRSKSNLRDYAEAHFIQKVTPEYVDFYLSSRPFVLTFFDLPYYVSRTRMQRVVKHIPRSHARWIGNILGQLSAEQIRDCFRGAGYSPDEVEGFARVVEQRIGQLRQL